MRLLRLLPIIGVLFALALPVSAQSTFILTVSPANAQTVLQNHNLTVIKELHDGANCLYLVSSASSDALAVQSDVASDILVGGFESDQRTALPELSGLTQPTLTQSTTSILDTLPGRTLVPFFGSTVPSNYINQPATTIVRLSDARSATGLTGAGVVAIIDTGADPNHPALA
ncbi:MAG: hypothetical protein ACRD4F_06410, partial [Candidatus Angelobacter sp.]